RAVDAIRFSNGYVAAVSDAEIFAAKRVIDGCGVGCEPASAASVAGVRSLVAQGTIGPQQRVVAVLTGHLLKDPGTLLQYHRDTEPPPSGANRPVEIDADLREVERQLGK
ncbi:MAG TPA: pyridoxal-phosphate dependent enzyme, partial [Candidatus Eisenbacteria bacterium]|nr:pyridoxal-phosphate dependent enzyme [Candidatus Eisenbacteria bacterium]